MILFHKIFQQIALRGDTYCVPNWLKFVSKILIKIVKIHPI
jgi:hypothetical protein